MNRNLLPVGPWLLAVCLVASCIGSGETETAASAESALLDSAVVAESVASAAASDSTTPDPFAGFPLEAGPEVSADPRRLRLLLRNDAGLMAIVRADGGAGEVVLDSVPPASRRRVDLLTRAPTVTLRVQTSEGRALRTVEVVVGTDSLTEVLVGAADGP